MNRLLNLLRILTLLLSTAAHAADVTFGVNLQYQIQQGKFTVGTDQVVAVGSFSSTGLALADPDGDKIYTATLTNQTADAQLSYNYRFTHGGATTNETLGTRYYVVQATTAANVLADWFNNQLPPYPYAKFFASSVKTIPGEVVRFNDASEGGAATSWSWSFQGGNPATSTAQSPTCTWGTAGTYTVTMSATNASGSTTAKSLTVTVTTVDNALGWWNDAVFYQIYPRSFLDSNGNGTGDLQGLTTKLDYLNDGNASTTTDLGVTALYLMPVHDASEPQYGGYEVRDYKSIIAEYGTQANFDAFVTAAHQRGMKVILDMVFNHTSDEHPWFQAAAQGAGSKYDNYYVWRADNPGSNWRTNPVAHSNTVFNNYWGKFGVKTPDLNFNEPSVRNAIKDVTSFWLGKGLDGFRLDAPMFLYENSPATTDAQQQNLPQTYAYWRDWRTHLKATNANAFSIGETWLLGDVPGAAKYVYQGFDVGFQFDIAFGIEDALNNENKSYLQNPVEQSMQYYPFLQFGIFASNHDLYARNSGNINALRLKDRLTNNKDAKARVAAAFVLTGPGVPFVYYGDEVGASGGFARTPMQWDGSANAGFTTGTPWLAVGSDYATYNVAAEQGKLGSFLSLYQQLIAIRKSQTALRRGTYKTVTTTSTGVYAFARSYNGETVFVVLNTAASAQNNVALSLSGTGIADGTYALTNLIDANQTVGAVTVSGGNISGWVPTNTISANGFYILKLGAVTTAAPAAPSSLALSQYSSSAVNVTWNSNTTSATGYRLYWSTTNTKPATANASTTATAGPGAQQNYIVQGLNTSTTYYFWVEAYNAAGTSAAITGSQTLTLTAGTTAYYIINVWKGTYLFDNGSQQVAYGAASTAAAYQWTLEAVSGNSNLRLKNVGTGNYMNIEGQQAYVQTTPGANIPSTYASSQWVLQPYAGYTRILTAWNNYANNYVNVEGQTGFAQYANLAATFTSSQWSFRPVAGTARLAVPAASAASPAASAALQVYPNPSDQGRLTLLLPTSAATARVRLLDGQGRVVLDRPAALLNSQAQLDVTGLARGLYLVQATAEGQTYSNRVVIE